MRYAVMTALLLGASQITTPAEESPDTFTLWQLPEQTPTQMMSYVIQTINGQVIVIDGGNTGDAAYLKGFIAALGNKVDVWFISHMHLDHVDALNEIMTHQNPPKILEVVTTLPEMAWLEEHCNIDRPGARASDSKAGLLEGTSKLGIPIRDVVLGEEFEIDGIQVKVLGIINPEITANAVNNSSLVWRMWDDHKSVLFTGDIGAEAGDKLLDTPYAEYLPSDIVQMSHHGQVGASKEFYAKVNARYALWPTPDWLWFVDNGGGVGSGPWQTLEVREWMEALGIEENFVSKDGLHKIR